MIRETWNDSNFLTRNGITKPSLNLKAEICEYGEQREGIICDMIINCVYDRKCANEELKLNNLSRHLNTKKLKFQIMSLSEEQVIRICKTAIGDRV